MPNRFNQRTAAATEDKNIAGEWVPAKPLLHLQHQAPHATAHIRVTGCDPNPYPGGNRDHCNARSAAVTNAAEAEASIVSRTPDGNSTVIDPGIAVADAGARDGGADGTEGKVTKSTPSVMIAGT